MLNSIIAYGIRLNDSIFERTVSCLKGTLNFGLQSPTPTPTHHSKPSTRHLVFISLKVASDCCLRLRPSLKVGCVGFLT
jgi:hypothetical protein